LLVESDSKKHIKNFILRRWYRTLPAYFFAIVCAIIIFDFGSYINLFKFISYTQNFFGDNSNPNFYPVAWSLSVEEWFYILIPLFLLLFSTLKFRERNKLLFLCIIIIIILSISKILAIYHSVDWGEEIRRSVIYRLDALCWGIVAFLYKDKIKTLINLIILITFTSILIFFFLNLEFLNSNFFAKFIFFPSCSLSFSSILIFCSNIKIETKLIKNLGKFLANISYSMYLFHIFFITIFNNKFENILFSLSIYLITLMIFCNLFYNYFEKPILKLRPNYKN